ncbi:MAG: thiol:disulfide interchange protein DsbA [Gammaproteobacteria bacterium]|jgi:thiol:disulfide interchange protein DsbA
MIKKWALALSLITVFLISTSASAQQAYVEGVDYKAISQVVKTTNPDKVVVTEMFWYGCPHCFRFEPYIENWEKTMPDGVVFEQVPSVLNPSWAIHARSYYAFKLMGVLDQVHKKLFDAIHVKRQRLNSIDQMAGFVAEQGLDEKVFRESYASFPVDTQIRKNTQIEQQYGHNGVPAVIINGKYLASGSMAGSNDRLIKIIDFLVASELANQ